MTEPRFYDLLTELERIIKEDPVEENLARFSELIKDKTLYKFAFSNLLSSNWVQPLTAKGFFTNPPSPIQDESKNTVFFPFWPESEYLARIAKAEPEVVQSIILRIKTDNVRVHEDFASAALSMPPSIAATWIEQEVKWLESQNDLSIFRLPDQLAKIAVHISKGGYIDSALLLIRVLLAVFLDPKNNGVTQSAFPPEPRARFDIGEYEIILQKHLPEVTAIAAEGVLHLLCDLLNDTVRFSLSQPDELQPEDYSYIWQPAIEHDEQHVLKNVLVSAVRDISLAIAQKDTSQIPTLVNQLESYPWIIFQRISLHLLRNFSKESIDIISERLTDRKLFYSSGLRHEYALLSRDCFCN